MEQVDARLADANLLAVAHGHDPAACKAILDVDLSAIPLPDPTHRDYLRIMERRIVVDTQNRANAQKRFTLKMEAWTKVYTLLKISTEKTAPVLSRELFQLCDVSKLYGIDGGFFDGPRAYRIVSEKLLKSHRTNADKEFYRTAERIQRDSRLSDGALAADYAQKALAFLVHIRPYLAQSYDDDETTDSTT